ncbi:MAG TPA: RNB domain-containing ribonuclease, partial [Thermoleophilia bacterium]|nr:RNB domain-containing ribonuclease [Thermoleophilia bacterium]
RGYLVARGGRAPRLDDVVLAVPAKRNRMQIVEVLGTTHDLPAVLQALEYANHVRCEFPGEVRDEATAVAGRGARRDPDRRDLAALPTFTIDPDTARDFDDAISVQREGGGFRAWVHIADVSHYVDPDGAIDAEARRRTASLYLPLWAEPMLPAELSSGVCSLVEGEPRKTVTVEFVFDAEGRRTAVSFYRSLIVSDRRLTYGFVDEVLAGREPGEAPRADGSALRDHLLLADQLAGLLRAARFARGALQIGSFEPEYRFDARGELVAAEERLESPSHSLVEEFMLAANEAVAQFLAQRHAQALYRVHEPPDPAATAALLDAMEELDVPTPPFPEAERATAREVAGALRRLSETLPTVSARERRGRLAFPQLLLRSLKQARYDPANLGHFGLASDGYLHFTSPIRRYPDLVVHRALLHRLGDGGDELPPGELHEVAERCSTQERVIAKLELRADDIALAFLLERRLHDEGWDTVFDGEIVGLIGGGVFVHFGGSFEGFVPVRHLSDEYVTESRFGTAMVGSRTGRRHRLGDAIRVRVVRVDRVSGKVELVPASTGLEGDDDGSGRRGAGRQRPAPRRPKAQTSVHGPRRPSPRSSTGGRKGR